MVHPLMLHTVPHTPLYSTSTLPVLALLPPERRMESVALPKYGREGWWEEGDREEGRRGGKERGGEQRGREREEGGEEEEGGWGGKWWEWGDERRREEGRRRGVGEKRGARGRGGEGRKCVWEEGGQNKYSIIVSLVQTGLTSIDTDHSSIWICSSTTASVPKWITLCWCAGYRWCGQRTTTFKAKWILHTLLIYHSNKHCRL